MSYIGNNANTLLPLAQAGHPHKVNSLPGGQNLVKHYLENHQLQAPWDTEREIPTNLRLRDVCEILDSPNDLTLTTANKMPYVGWIEITLQLASETNQAEELMVPVLGMKGWHLSSPIIGFSVIEQLLTKTEENQQYHAVRKAFQTLKRNKLTAFIHTVWAERADLYAVKSEKEKVAV